MDVVKKNACLKRPILSNPSFLTAARVLRNRLGVEVGASKKVYRVGFSDSRVKNNVMMDRVQEKLKSGFLVGKALKMGFEKREIKRVLVERFKSHNLNYSNFCELLEALTRIGASEKEDDGVVLTLSEALKA